MQNAKYTRGFDLQEPQCPQDCPCRLRDRGRQQRAVAPSHCSVEGSGSFLNEASAELAESSKVARLGQRPLLRKARAQRDSIGANAVLGAAIRVHRFFEPLSFSSSANSFLRLARGRRVGLPHLRPAGSTTDVKSVAYTGYCQSKGCSETRAAGRWVVGPPSSWSTTRGSTCQTHSAHSSYAFSPLRS